MDKSCGWGEIGLLGHKGDFSVSTKSKQQIWIQTCESYFTDNCIPSCDAELISELLQCSGSQCIMQSCFNLVRVIIKDPELFNVVS